MSLKYPGNGPLFRRLALVARLAATLQPLVGVPPGAAKEAEVKAPELVAAFLKGPVSLSAKINHRRPGLA
jgi:hypothetical protein